ncbi:MAG: cation diffusion facilitator family transporter [Desulfobacterales bacterium]
MPQNEIQRSELQRESKQIQRVALASFGLNVVLAVVKVFLAVHANSLAISASAIDSAADAAASLILYVGLKISARKTPRFPSGLYKIENVISVVIAFLLFYTGYDIARRVVGPPSQNLQVSQLTVGVLALATAAVMLLGLITFKIGRQTESPALIAEGRHRAVDGLVSLVVLVSVTLGYFGIHWRFHGVTIDQMAAGVVTIFILINGWKLLSDGMRVLLDASIDFDTLEKVRQIIVQDPLVSEVKSLVGRNAGRFRFLQIEIAVRTKDLDKAHRATERIESAIRQQIPHVESVNIHYEPRASRQWRIAVPLSDRIGTIGRRFGESPFFALLTLRRADSRIEEQKIIENPFARHGKGRGIRTSEWLANQEEVDEVILKEDIEHKGPGFVFGDAGIQINRTDAEHLNSIIESLSKN